MEILADLLLIVLLLYITGALDYTMFAKCSGLGCEDRDKCHRSTAPTKPKQLYFSKAPKERISDCPNFVSNEGKKKNGHSKIDEFVYRCRH